MRILKFGGSSVGTPAAIGQVAAIVSREVQAGHRVAVVVSAFQQVTDQLIAMSRLAASGDASYLDVLADLTARHLEAVRALVPGERRRDNVATLGQWLDDLRDVLHGVFLVRDVSMRTLDFVMSFGERCSAYVVSQTLGARGVPAEFLDARSVIRTDAHFGFARVDASETTRRLREHFAEHHAVQVVTGFIGATASGDTTTLGRGGSDYTAAILGAALGAEEIQIWTDVDGVLTADPRKVQKAFPVPSMTYEEAMELSHFGAKVIYPPTLQPALTSNIPVRILNTFNPDGAGTRIHNGPASSPSVVTGVSSTGRVALLLVRGAGMVGVAGVAQRLFGALSRQGISVILVTQASSEHTICLAVAPDVADAAAAAIDEDFALEIRSELVSPAVIDRDMCVVSAVGENMAHTPGIAGRLFQALGRNGLNVAAIAQGSSELNISAVIRLKDEAKALNAIHDEFFLAGSRSLNVFLAGTGLVGSTLLRQVQQHARQLRDQHGLDLRVIAAANSRHLAAHDAGLPLDGLLDRLEASREPGGVAALLAVLQRLNLPNSVFVDCTSSQDVIARYPEILEASVSIVTPNKRAQSGEYRFYRELKQTARRRNAEFLYETSVGAGLPVIGTLNDLLRSGDEILRIDAVLSGTLSYIFNAFTGERPFSAVVRDAMALGYTEPDPREDLNGLDVARKLLILARESGLVMEMQDVVVEGLVPESCRQAPSVDEFLAELERTDGDFESLRAAAAAEGRRLCYIASLADGRAAVGLQAIGADHPFAGLSGSDNVISFRTPRYCDRPLVVKGPGAGAEVTAAGVLADIIRVGNYYLRG